MKKLLLFSLMGMTLSPMVSMADHLADRLTFSARMAAPVGVTTTGHGVAAFMLNSTRDTLYFSTSTASLTSAITGYHIHNGRTGGNIVLDFDGMVYGNTVRSFITGSTLATLLPELMDGNLYIAAHTVNNPAVEILGIIKLETDWNFHAMLDGTQAGTSSTKMGWCSINFGMNGDTAEIRMVSNLTNSILDGHLHAGKIGQNGGVILPLGSTIRSDSGSMMGGVSISGAPWTALMVALMADSVYINLHTAAFPAGEIRGQLMTSKTLRFDGWMNQAAEIAGGSPAPVASNGAGVISAWMNQAMDTLTWAVFFKDLKGNVTGSHFHNGPANGTGSVVKPITVSGNMGTGVWTKNDATNPLTSNMISQLLMGELYINIHTDSNPGGEIRGQVYRLAREGFIGEMNGAQAGTTSGGQGTVVATYDRARTNLHSMVAFEGLQGTVTDGHIHAGKAGQNGGVILPLSPFTNGGSYKYSKAADGFTDAVSIAMRRNDSAYVNIHTTTVGSGEIRGQLMRYYRISSQTIDTTTTGLSRADLQSIAPLMIYPNPASSTLNLLLNTPGSSAHTVQLIDMQGRTCAILEVPAGQREVSVDVSAIVPGMYMLEMTGTDIGKVTTRFIRN